MDKLISVVTITILTSYNKVDIIPTDTSSCDPDVNMEGDTMV